MPIDPVTGERLPYPGEPGAPPMPPAGPGAAPMPGPGPMGPPPGPMPGGPEDEAMARVADLASQAPQPKKPYSVKALQTLIGQMNDTIDELGGGDLPDLEVDFGGEKRWDQPLPPDLFVPLVALSEAVKLVAGGEFAEKYAFDPLEIVDDVQVRKATAQLRRMAKDKKLVEAMQAPMGSEEAELPPPPAPGALPPEDEELAAGLA